MYSDVQKSYYTTKKPFNHLSETYSSAVKHVFINICLKTRSFYNNIFDMSIVCPNHSLHSFKQWFYLFFFFFALFEDSHYCSCLQSIPERQSCDVTVCFALFWDLVTVEEKPWTAALLARPQTSHTILVLLPSMLGSMSCCKTPPMRNLKLKSLTRLCSIK